MSEFKLTIVLYTFRNMIYQSRFNVTITCCLSYHLRWEINGKKNTFNRELSVNQYTIKQSNQNICNHNKIYCKTKNKIDICFDLSCLLSVSFKFHWRKKGLVARQSNPSRTAFQALKSKFVKGLEIVFSPW